MHPKFMTFHCIPVSWKMSTHSVVIGQNITLSCNYQNTTCTNTDVKAWFGPRCSFLCSNGKCRDRKKYIMNIDNTAKVFNLQIRNVVRNDLTNLYTCTCGSFKDEHQISLKGMEIFTEGHDR